MRYLGILVLLAACGGDTTTESHDVGPVTIERVIQVMTVTNSARAFCPTDTVAIGGGCGCAGATAILWASALVPAENAWDCECRNNNADIVVQTFCLKDGEVD